MSNGSAGGGGSFTFPTRPAGSTAARDRAEITVKGHKFDDWESVWVQLPAAEGWPFFRFTVAEREASAGIMNSVGQFQTLDECTITMGGVKVIEGVIEVRQVAYDAGSHHVELQGRGLTAWPARSSVHVKNGELDGKTLEEACKKALEGYKSQVKTVGKVPSTKFDKIQVQPGEMIWDFMERLARPRGVVLGIDHEGNFLLIGQNAQSSGGSTDLIEGKNIKRMQCVFDDKDTYQHYITTGSNAGTDEHWGPKVSRELNATYKGSQKQKCLLTTPIEHPVLSKEEIDQRCEYEAKQREYTSITASVVVQGWFRTQDNLWWPNDVVHVKSPMCPLDQQLGIQHVTFTQELNGGTQTTLDLVRPN
jgi:prophage tail gpP-like protein